MTNIDTDQDWKEPIQLRLERGLKSGLEDLEHGRIEEINDVNTDTRIARFKERSKHSDLIVTSHP